MASFSVLYQFPLSSLSVHDAHRKFMCNVDFVVRNADSFTLISRITCKGVGDAKKFLSRIQEKSFLSLSVLYLEMFSGRKEKKDWMPKTCSSHDDSVSLVFLCCLCACCVCSRFLSFSCLLDSSSLVSKEEEEEAGRFARIDE